MALISTTKPELRIPQRTHAEQVAPAYGLTADDLDVIDSGTDPRQAPLLAPQNQAPETIKALVDTILADIETILIVSPVIRAQLQARLLDRFGGNR